MANESETEEEAKREATESTNGSQSKAGQSAEARTELDYNSMEDTSNLVGREILARDKSSDFDDDEEDELGQEPEENVDEENVLNSSNDMLIGSIKERAEATYAAASNADPAELSANNLLSNMQVAASRQASGKSTHSLINRTSSFIDMNQVHVPKQITVSWRNLMYSVERSSVSLNNCFSGNDGHSIVRKFKRTILKGINGHFSTGNLTAVMGPSGSGKSTMLECIVGFRKKGLSGDIRVHSDTGQNVKVALINQSDYLIESFTVREMLVYASRLKNYRKVDEEEAQLEEVVTVSTGQESTNNLNTIDASSKGNLIEVEKAKNYHHKLALNVIHQLGLDVCIDTKAGSCSGGQKKRISIALEMISK